MRFLSDRLVKEFDQPIPGGAAVMIMAAEHLEKYAEILSVIAETNDDAEEILTIDELAEHLRNLSKPFTDRTPYKTADEAAKIIHDMLVDWARPGSVWFNQNGRRFRLAGEGYEPGIGDECVGVYLPTAPLENLVDDLKFVMDSAG